MDSSRIAKVILKNCQKNLKNDPFNRKKWNFQKTFKSLKYVMGSAQYSYINKCSDVPSQNQVLAKAKLYMYPWMK